MGDRLLIDHFLIKEFLYPDVQNFCNGIEFDVGDRPRAILNGVISEAIEKAKSRSVQSVIQPEKPQGDAMDSLRKLAALRDSGIITEEEFNQKKNELLGKI